jgi:hypothetical protein
MVFPFTNPMAGAVAAWASFYFRTYGEAPGKEKTKIFVDLCLAKGNLSKNEVKFARQLLADLEVISPDDIDVEKLVERTCRWMFQKYLDRGEPAKAFEVARIFGAEKITKTT